MASADWRGDVGSFLGATVLGGVIVAARLPFQHALGANVPLLLAWPAVVVAAAVGGFWSALLVCGIGVAMAYGVVAEAGGAPLGLGIVATYLAFSLLFAGAGGAWRHAAKLRKADAGRRAELHVQMIQASRRSAMGELAGSLSHELNQPLTAVANYLTAAEQLLEREEIPKARVAELMRKASDQAVRAGQIVAQVRANVDRGEIALAQESAAGMVQDAVEAAAGGEARDGVAIRYDFDGAADQVMADRTQVQQVVLNLVRNALEAMEDGQRRELSIGSEPADGGFVKLHVADTGQGVAPQVADRLFRPFVSDKTGGMGVGLSASRNIIEAHGGRMWMEANSDGGATFHFTLKRVEEEA